MSWRLVKVASDGTKTVVAQGLGSHDAADKSCSAALAQGHSGLQVEKVDDDQSDDGLTYKGEKLRPAEDRQSRN